MHRDGHLTGTVIGKDDGLPLPGVSFSAKGSKAGTTTGASGTFKFTVPSGVTELTFSFLGYATLTIVITPGEMKISMAVDSRQLSDVVVTGVATATDKRKIVVDVATLSSKNFAKSVATGSVEQSLQGQIAGAVI